MKAKMSQLVSMSLTFSSFFFQKNVEKCWDSVVFASFFEILCSKKYKYTHFSMSQTFSKYFWNIEKVWDIEKFCNIAKFQKMKALTSESQNFSTLKVLAKASCMIGLKGLSILLSKTLRYREILRSLIRKINKVKQAKIHCAKVGRVKVICPKHYINRYAYALVQLNKYETALNFIQISQNLTLDCLLI